MIGYACSRHELLDYGDAVVASAAPRLLMFTGKTKDALGLWELLNHRE